MLLHYGKRQILINISKPDYLGRGLGLHRLRFPVEVDTRNTIPMGVQLHIRGQVWLNGIQRDWLGFWQLDEPAVTRDIPSPTHLVLPLTDDQLAVIEKARAEAGGNLHLGYEVIVEIGSYPEVAELNPDDRWPSKSAQDQLYLHSDEWVRLLNQVSTGMSLAIVLSLDGNDPIGTHLREAIRKIRNSEYADAVGEARKCFDVWKEIGIQQDSLPSITSTPRDDRTFEQRVSLLGHGLWAVAGPAPHGDANAKTMVWNRETSVAVVAGIAALVACRPYAHTQP